MHIWRGQCMASPRGGHCGGGGGCLLGPPFHREHRPSIARNANPQASDGQCACIMEMGSAYWTGNCNCAWAAHIAGGLMQRIGARGRAGGVVHWWGQGCGGAVRTGLCRSRSDLCSVCPADASHVHASSLEAAQSRADSGAKWQGNGGDRRA